MKHTVLYNNGIHYLIERRFDTGEIKEYVCCTNYNPETDSWNWGHYFTTFWNAAKFFHREWEDGKKIALLIHDRTGQDLDITAYDCLEDAEKAAKERIEEVKEWYDEETCEEYNIDFGYFKDDDFEDSVEVYIAEFV